MVWLFKMVLLLPSENWCFCHHSFGYFVTLIEEYCHQAFAHLFGNAFALGRMFPTILKGPS